MSTYRPTVWSRKYQQLSPTARDLVNKLTNEVFRTKTGVSRRLDPDKDGDLVRQWLEARDHVMAYLDKVGSTVSSIAQTAAKIASSLPMFGLLDSTPEWIKIARREIGQTEIPGSRHNPRIMTYIRTCRNIQKTAAQRKYVEREGEEGVEWCSAFMNWCMIQAGSKGTNHALASSWRTWGTTLTQPKIGAIALFSWRGTRIDHATFVDEVGGAFKMLGGNQRAAGGKVSNQVSSVPLRQSKVKTYRWPA